MTPATTPDGVADARPGRAYAAVPIAWLPPLSPLGPSQSSAARETHGPYGLPSLPVPPEENGKAHRDSG